MCIGDIRRLNIPVTQAFGRYGNGQGIPGFISVTMDIELKDHYPRVFSPYYLRRIDKEGFFQERIEDIERRLEEHDRQAKLSANKTSVSVGEYQKRRLRREEIELQKNKKELENLAAKKEKERLHPRPRWIRDPDEEKRYPLPYRYMETEYLEAGLAGYSPEERQRLQSLEDHERYYPDKDLEKRHQRAEKYYNLTVMIIKKQQILDAYAKDPTNERLKGFVDAMPDPFIRKDKPIVRGITEYRFNKLEKEKERLKKKHIMQEKKKHKAHHQKQEQPKSEL